MLYYLWIVSVTARGYGCERLNSGSSQKAGIASDTLLASMPWFFPNNETTWCRMLGK
ncbi:hypothetical protein ACFL0Z_00850 [Patescibacteria group bacterium]